MQPGYVTTEADTRQHARARVIVVRRDPDWPEIVQASHPIGGSPNPLYGS